MTDRQDKPMNVETSKTAAVKNQQSFTGE